MNKPESNKRLLWFAVLVFLLASAKIGYAAVPQSTVRTTTPGGITTYVGQYVNATVEYYRGTQNYTAWILAKAGAGGGWPVFDQDLNTTDAVTFANVNATWEYYRGGANYTQWILAKADAATTTFDQSLDTTDHVSFGSVNATGEFYRNGNNYTAWIESAILAGTGGWPVFDQDLNTTDNVSFASVNATTEFYRGGVNYTATIEGLIAASAGGWPVFDQGLNTTDDVTFDNVTASDGITLGGVKRTTWPSAASGTAIFLDTVTCKIEGAYYVAYLADGVVLYNNTSAFTCLQTALDFTTYNAGSTPTYLKGRVYNYTSVRVGPGYWDIGANDLDIPNKVNFGGEGRDATIIKGSLANAVVKNMWSNYTFAVDIHDMRLELTIKTVPLNTPAAALFYYTYDFYPDPEEWLNLKQSKHLYLFDQIHIFIRRQNKTKDV